MLPVGLEPCTDPCLIAPRLGISMELAWRLVRMAQEPHLPFRLSVISGYRSCGSQAELAIQGRTSLPCCSTGRRPCSTHTTVPAIGADVWPSVAVTNAVKASLGRAAAFAGLRWGGGSPKDADGFPIDWNHLDLGPVG